MYNFNGFKHIGFKLTQLQEINIGPHDRKASL